MLYAQCACWEDNKFGTLWCLWFAFHFLLGELISALYSRFVVLLCAFYSELPFFLSSSSFLLLLKQYASTFSFSLVASLVDFVTKK
jgi:hypothetical protein